ncbi:MAG TPA: PaaI family thioesterase [Candidatus Thermoplasmatota archaeon]
MPKSTAKPHPGFEQRVKDSFARQRIMRLMGATLGKVKAGSVEIQLKRRDDLVQQHGFLHAGVLGTIADSAGGYAGYTLMPPTSSVLTIEYKLHLLRPAVGESFLARGVVKRAGRNITVTEMEVEAVDGRKRTLCAWGTQTLMQVSADGLGRPPG